MRARLLLTGLPVTWSALDASAHSSVRSLLLAASLIVIGLPVDASEPLSDAVSARYAGAECIYFTRPVAGSVGNAIRLDRHPNKARVCYQDEMYQCVDKHWKYLGACTDYVGWQNLVAAKLEGTVFDVGSGRRSSDPPRGSGGPTRGNNDMGHSRSRVTNALAHPGSANYPITCVCGEEMVRISVRAESRNSANALATGLCDRRCAVALTEADQACEGLRHQAEAAMDQVSGAAGQLSRDATITTKLQGCSTFLARLQTVIAARQERNRIIRQFNAQCLTPKQQIDEEIRLAGLDAKDQTESASAKRTIVRRYCE